MNWKQDKGVISRVSREIVQKLTRMSSASGQVEREPSISRVFFLVFLLFIIFLKCEKPYTSWNGWWKKKKNCDTDNYNNFTLALMQFSTECLCESFNNYIQIETCDNLYLYKLMQNNIICTVHQYFMQSFAHTYCTYKRVLLIQKSTRNRADDSEFDW